MSIHPQDDSLCRRDVLCAGGAAMLSAMLGILLGGAKPARAQGITGPVPEVDGLAVRVVVDSYQIAVVPDTTAGDVEIQHFGWGIGGGKPPGRTLISEFGLSMLAESRRGDETRNILMDFSFTPGALSNNFELLGIDPAGLDALVLSRPLRSLRRTHGVPPRERRDAEGQALVLRWRRGVLLLARMDRAAGTRRLRRARPQGFARGRSGRDLCRAASARRRLRLYHGTNRAEEFREGTIAQRHDDRRGG